MLFLLEPSRAIQSHANLFSLSPPSPQLSPCHSWICAAARCAWPWGRSVWLTSTRYHCRPPSRPTSSTSDAPPLHRQHASHLVPPCRPAAVPRTSDRPPAPCPSAPAAPAGYRQLDAGSSIPRPDLGRSPLHSVSTVPLRKSADNRLLGSPPRSSSPPSGCHEDLHAPCPDLAGPRRRHPGLLQEQIPGPLRGARMRAGAEASGAMPQQTTLRTSETLHGH